MVKLPAHDGRLMHLGEAEDLLSYARVMRELLEQRWDKESALVSQRCYEAGYDEEEFNREYQYEEYQHAKYDVYLDGQLVLSAWSLLQGAVEYCAAFLAEKLSIDAKLSSLRLPRQPAEKHWQYYYEETLGVSWPLAANSIEVSRLRNLRNDYAHSLFFEPFSVRGRLTKIDVDLNGARSDFLYGVGEFSALQGQGVPACELAAKLVQALKEHSLSLAPHDGVSFSLWERTQ